VKRIEISAVTLCSLLAAATHGATVADSSSGALTGAAAGFAAPVPGALLSSSGLSLEDADSLLSGLSISCGASAYYDSNIGQRAGTAADPRQDDFILSISPSVQWLRGTSLWNLSLAASGRYGHPFEDSNYDSMNRSFSVSGAYHAGRLELSGNLNQGFSEGSNRYYGEVIRQSSYGMGFTAAYEISPKTSLISSFNSSWNEPDSGLGATENQSANLSAMWRYSPLLRFGPGIGYSSASGDIESVRSTLGPTLSAVYELSRKVSMSGRVGLDFADSGDSGTNQTVSSSLAASYRLNRLWEFDASMSRGIQADGGSRGAFREDTALRFGVNHPIRRVAAAVGLGYVHSTYLASSDSGQSPGIDYLSIDTSLSLPFSGNRASATVFFRYNDSVSDNEAQNWDGFQSGVSVNYRF
jgi:hypothetical protein